MAFILRGELVPFKNLSQLTFKENRDGCSFIKVCSSTRVMTTFFALYAENGILIGFSARINDRSCSSPCFSLSLSSFFSHSGHPFFALFQRFALMVVRNRDNRRIKDSVERVPRSSRTIDRRSLMLELLKGSKCFVLGFLFVQLVRLCDCLWHN